MARTQNACLVCGQPLRYFDTEREMTCSSCGKAFPSRASCVEGHFICDSCHAQKGIAVVMDYCRRTTGTDPVAMVQEMMDDPYIYMHGPEHHIMVGAALLAAYHNAGGQLDLDRALDEMQARGSAYPGGSCGFWGACGAAVSAGMFLSIVNGTTPLSGRDWGLANQITARCLEQIAALGGPRCCKRNSFTALKTAVALVREQTGLEMQLPQKIQCRWSQENPQCIRKKCPYYPG